MDTHKRLNLIILSVILVVLGGAAGYYYLFQGEARFLSCLFMTVISLTSVGYGEIIPVSGNVPAELFTMILITFGMGIILYGISTFTAMTVEGAVTGLLRRNRMEKRIAKLKDHYIVCGAGQTGRHVIEELLKNREETVFIDHDENNIQQVLAMGDVLYIKGDATDDTNLVLAGIERAKGIVVSLPSDKDTLYITMTARMLNPSVRIVSRMVEHKIEAKLRKAGASAVVSPNFIGGLRMASELIRPTVVSFLDLMLRNSTATLRISEFEVSGESKLKGKTLRASGIKDKYSLLVLGAKRPKDMEILFNPPPDMELVEGTTLVLMGEVDQVVRLRQET
jgi:voltage-gated potassium channel